MVRKLLLLAALFCFGTAARAQTPVGGPQGTNTQDIAVGPNLLQDSGFNLAGDANGAFPAATCTVAGVSGPCWGAATLCAPVVSTGFSPAPGLNSLQIPAGCGNANQNGIALNQSFVYPGSYKLQTRFQLFTDATFQGQMDNPFRTQTYGTVFTGSSGGVSMPAAISTGMGPGTNSAGWFGVYHDIYFNPFLYANTTVNLNVRLDNYGVAGSVGNAYVGQPTVTPTDIFDDYVRWPGPKGYLFGTPSVTNCGSPAYGSLAVNFGPAWPQPFAYEVCGTFEVIDPWDAGTNAAVPLTQITISVLEGTSPGCAGGTPVQTIVNGGLAPFSNVTAQSLTNFLFAPSAPFPAMWYYDASGFTAENPPATARRICASVNVNYSTGSQTIALPDFVFYNVTQAFMTSIPGGNYVDGNSCWVHLGVCDFEFADYYSGDSSDGLGNQNPNWSLGAACPQHPGDPVSCFEKSWGGIGQGTPLSDAQGTVISQNVTLSRSANVVTVTLLAPPISPLLVGGAVTEAGVTDSSYNGNFTIASTPTLSSFTYAQTASNSSTTGGTSTFTVPLPHTTPLPAPNASLARASNVVTVTLSAAPNFPLYVNEPVTEANVTDSSYNGTFAIATVTGSTTFTYAQTGSNSSTTGGTSTLTALKLIHGNQLSLFSDFAAWMTNWSLDVQEEPTCNPAPGTSDCLGAWMEALADWSEANFVYQSNFMFGAGLSGQASDTAGTSGGNNGDVPCDGFSYAACPGPAVSAGAPVRVTWTPQTGGSFTYNLYRLAAVCPATLPNPINGAAGWTRIATGLSGPPYSDLNVAAGTYCYASTTVNSAGESAPSNSSQLAVPRGNFFALGSNPFFVWLIWTPVFQNPAGQTGNTQLTGMSSPPIAAASGTILPSSPNVITVTAPSCAPTYSSRVLGWLPSIGLSTSASVATLWGDQFTIESETAIPGTDLPASSPWVPCGATTALFGSPSVAQASESTTNLPPTANDITTSPGTPTCSPCGTTAFKLEIQGNESGGLITLPSAPLSVGVSTAVTMPACTGSIVNFLVELAPSTASRTPFNYFLQTFPGQEIPCSGTYTTPASAAAMVAVAASRTDTSALGLPSWVSPGTTDLAAMKQVAQTMCGADSANFPHAQNAAWGFQPGDEANPWSVNNMFYQLYGANGVLQWCPGLLVDMVNSDSTAVRLERHFGEEITQDPYFAGGQANGDVNWAGGGNGYGCVYNGRFNQPAPGSPAGPCTQGAMTSGTAQSSVLLPQRLDVALISDYFGGSYGVGLRPLTEQVFQVLAGTGANAVNGFPFLTTARNCKKNFTIIEAEGSDGLGCQFWTAQTDSGQNVFYFNFGNTNVFEDMRRMRASQRTAKMRRTTLSPTIDSSLPKTRAGFFPPCGLPGSPCSNSAPGGIIQNVQFYSTTANNTLLTNSQLCYATAPAGAAIGTSYANQTFWNWGPVVFATKRDPVFPTDWRIDFDYLCVQGALSKNTGGLPAFALVTFVAANIPAGATGLEVVDGDYEVPQQFFYKLGSNALCPTITPVPANAVCFPVGNLESLQMWLMPPYHNRADGYVTDSGRVVKQ